MEGSFLFLGTGGSMGIPVLGCSCLTCQSCLTKDKRLRCAALIRWGEAQWLLDAGPDLRQQLLVHQVSQIEGLLVTHSHYDHIAGLDELRAICFRRQAPLPLLLSKATYGALLRYFPHLFPQEEPLFAVKLLPEAKQGSCLFGRLPLRYLTYSQASMEVTGFVLGDLAYLSDIKEFPETIFEELRAIRTLIVSALRYSPSPVHLSVDEAIAFAERVGAERTYLTHVAHDLRHELLELYLPEKIKVAYDGLSLSFSLEALHG